MKLTVLGSSSSGNCYIIQNSTEALVIEAGVRFSDVQRALCFDLEKVSACLVSHEHGDHASQAAQFVAHCIPTYASAGTIEALQFKSSFLKRCEARRQFIAGRFSVLPFAVKHDATEPLGFLISHPDTGAILFATDTYYLPNRFANLRHMLIECNYIESVLKENVDSGRVPDVVAERVHQSHMELETTLGVLRANNLANVRNIVLIHVSGSNSDKELMRRRAIEVSGKNVVVAQSGLVINIDKEAF